MLNWDKDSFGGIWRELARADRESPFVDTGTRRGKRKHLSGLGGTFPSVSIRSVREQPGQKENMKWI